MTGPSIFENRGDIPSGVEITDTFDDALKELFFIENPRLRKDHPDAQKLLEEFFSRRKNNDVWIFYPWSNKLIHTLPEDLYFTLRTARNRNIITVQEQQKYRQIKVGIAGLSVGSAIVSSLVRSGGPKVLKIADFDIVELSNLNRMQATILDMGSNKTHVLAKQIWEIDPFAELHLWDSGLSRVNLDEFISGKPALDIFIDEMDGLDLKFSARLICRKNKIPVLMATDNGDDVIIDIERFDLEEARPVFHGLVDEKKPEELNNLNYRTWLKLSTQIVSPNYLTEKMQESLLEIGKTISAVPQLGTTASVAGAAISYAVRRIASHQNMPSGRYAIGLEEKLVPNFSSPDNVEKRAKKTNDFLNKFGKY